MTVRPSVRLRSRGVLKVGAVRYDESEKTLRVVVGADPRTVRTARITRDALERVETVPEDDRVPVTVTIESFPQTRAAEWEQVGTVEARAAQRWAFADVTLTLA